MKLSRAVACALGAVMQLSESKHGAAISCGRLAKAGELPVRFLLHVLQSLKAIGVRSSGVGTDTDFTLNRSLESISMLEIIEAIEGPVTASVPVTSSLSADSRDRLSMALERIVRLERAELQTLTLDKLLPSPIG